MGDCIEVGGECDPANFGGSKSESLTAKNAKERKERKERKEIRTNAAEIFFAPFAVIFLTGEQLSLPQRAAASMPANLPRALLALCAIPTAAAWQEKSSA